VFDRAAVRSLLTSAREPLPEAHPLAPAAAGLAHASDPARPRMRFGLVGAMMWLGMHARQTT
jgi:hypothetical protein